MEKKYSENCTEQCWCARVNHVSTFQIQNVMSVNWDYQLNDEVAFDYGGGSKFSSVLSLAYKIGYIL